jgi:hypothetical protein
MDKLYSSLNHNQLSENRKYTAKTFNLDSNFLKEKGLLVDTLGFGIAKDEFSTPQRHQSKLASNPIVNLNLNLA